jgi:hypothetical protein
MQVCQSDHQAGVSVPLRALGFLWRNRPIDGAAHQGTSPLPLGEHSMGCLAK